MRRWLRRAGYAVAALALGLIVAAIVLDRQADPALFPAAPGAPRVTVTVASHGYHAGLVLRRDRLAALAGERQHLALVAAMRQFAAYQFVEIGFGDEGFYRRAPTLASVQALDALRALFTPGNPTVLHVVGFSVPARAAFPASDLVEIEVSEAGFRRLAENIEASFARDGAGAMAHLGPGLYGPSLFYRGVGNFHIFNVCNHWLARQLSAAGVASNPVLATWPAGLIGDLVWRSRGRRL